MASVRCKLKETNRLSEERGWLWLTLGLVIWIGVDYHGSGENTLRKYLFVQSEIAW